MKILHISVEYEEKFATLVIYRYKRTFQLRNRSLESQDSDKYMLVSVIIGLKSTSSRC